MNNKQLEELKSQTEIFIDDIGVDELNDRTLDFIWNKYKDFYEGFLKNEKQQLKKEDADFQLKLKTIKKQKLKNKATRLDKVEFHKSIYEQIKEALKQEENIENYKLGFNKVKEEVSLLYSLNIYEQWFNWAIENGEGSYLATHIAKLTHSSSKGSSIDLRYFESTEKEDNRYLITSNFDELDTAYPNNTYSSISQLYQINVEGIYVGDILRNSPEKLLSKLITNPIFLEKACVAFSSMIKNENKQSYFLSKQVYFPIEGQKYHLLLPLTSSSLTQELHKEHQKHFDKEQTNARAQRKEGLYGSMPVINYPNKAKFNVTGSNHSNASSLNGKRGGILTLFSAQPPVWQAKMKSFGLFDDKDLYDYLKFPLKPAIRELNNYLKLLKNKQLNDSHPVRAASINRKVQAISDVLFDVILIANSNEQVNWTIDCNFSLPYQLLFEPYREDEKAQVEKTLKKWQEVISKDFARWLNNQLDKKRLELTTIHSELWAELFSRELRNFIAIQEIK